MKPPLIPRLAVLTLLVLALASIISAAAAVNTVPSTYLADQTRAINPLVDLGPAACASLTLSNLVLCPAGGGTCKGSNNINNLILGSAGADTLVGRNRDDCLVGGAGVNTFDGGNGNDICIGNPGDTYTSCETIIFR